MAKRFVDKEHLAWIRQQPCLMKQLGFYSCEGSVEAHHLLQPSTGFRAGIKSADSECLPLCRKHHALIHTKFGTEKAFFKSFGLPANYGKEMARKLYESSKSYRELDDDLPF